MIFLVNIFTFLGFFFFLLIHRRNCDNITALETYTEDGSQEDSGPAIKPVPIIWFILSVAFFLLGIFLR